MRFSRYGFLIEFCLLRRSLPGGRCMRDFRLKHRLGRIRPFSNRLACETDVFLRGSLARQKEVSTWILLNWFDLNHHFRGVFPLLEHLWVHLFCFSFPVEDCIIGQRTHFTPNACANKDIQLHQYETRVFDFWPHLLLLH